MNNLQLFDFEGNKVRTLKINDEPYLVGNDVAKILGYSNYRNAVVDHVDDEDKLRTQIRYAGQNRYFQSICFLNTDLIRCRKVQFSGLFLD